MELIAGRVYLKLPQTALHTPGLRATAEALGVAFGAGFDVRQQLPLVLTADGEPEPDVTIMPGTWRDYPTQPTQEQTLLVVEISDTTLRYDRREKAALYAQADIQDYWIVNLQNRTLQRASPIRDFEEALGQYTFYRELLALAGSDYELYLAVSDEANERVFERKALREITARSGIALVVVNLADEEIVKWKP